MLYLSSSWQQRQNNGKTTHFGYRGGGFFDEIIYAKLIITSIFIKTQRDGRNEESINEWMLIVTENQNKRKF